MPHGPRGPDVEVAAYLSDEARLHRPLLSGKAAEKRVVCQDVDRTGDAAGVLVNENHRLAGEQPCGIAAGGADASRNVADRLLHGERPQLAAKRNALLQLAEGRIVQPRGDFRLPGNYERQKRLRRHLDVRQQTDLVEQLRRETLRLVDDEDGRLVRLPALPQQYLELEEEVGLRYLRLRAEGELRRQHLDELVPCEGRVVEMHAVRSRRLTFDRRANRRGLAGAGFADQQRDPLAAGDAVFEVADRLAMDCGGDQIPRIGRQVEGSGGEFVELLVHGASIRERVAAASWRRFQKNLGFTTIVSPGFTTSVS